MPDGQAPDRHGSRLGRQPRQGRILPLTNPVKNDGKTVYKLKVEDVPVDTFWSISVFNDKGFFQKSAYGTYSVNSITGTKSTDGAIDIQFGGCDGKIANCLPITQGWNYTFPPYRPRAVFQNGTWKMPEAQPAS